MTDHGACVRRATIAGMAVTAMASLLALVGCAAPGLVTSSSCIDWVYFESPADAAADAEAVVLGSITGQSGSTSYEGMTANVWTVEVDQWLKGEGDDTVDVVSLPRSCGDADDSMKAFSPEDQVVVFLRSTDDGWEGITPWQQVLPAEDGGYPAVWPDDLYD
ncbi:hypothetical protein [Microbacterium sp. KHB019]|uniref:hypothetical protein n=1 Tax=Microbacterium sp. KHB019 TaxID=3129770 RepID=UPI00307AB700